MQQSKNELKSLKDKKNTEDIKKRLEKQTNRKQRRIYYND